MAKGYGLTGNLKGKKGSAIFYTIANSNSKVTQGVREYQPNVTNPRTTLQAAQRMKLAPLNNIYRQLQPILSRSFQGVKYGSLSRQEFIKRNLSGGSGVAIPYMQKGNLDAVPGRYLMSRGGLQGITMAQPENGLLTFVFDNPIVAPDGITFGMVSERFISSNPDVRNGDQITLIAIYYVQETGRYYSRYGSFYIDTHDQTQYNLRFQQAGFDDIVFDGNLMEVSFPTVSTLEQTSTPCARCVIQSRQLDQASDFWARSTSYMEVDMDIVGNLFSASAFDAALESYRQGASAGSDWETDSEGHDQTGNSGIPNSQVVIENMSFSINNQPYSIAAVGNEGHSIAGKAILWPFVNGAGTQLYLAGKVSGLTLSFPTSPELTAAQVAALGTGRWISYTAASPYLSRYEVNEPSVDISDDTPPTENP